MYALHAATLDLEVHRERVVASHRRFGVLVGDIRATFVEIAALGRLLVSDVVTTRPLRTFDQRYAVCDPAVSRDHATFEIVVSRFRARAQSQCRDCGDECQALHY